MSIKEYITIKENNSLFKFIVSKGLIDEVEPDFEFSNLFLEYTGVDLYKVKGSVADMFCNDVVDILNDNI